MALPNMIFGFIVMLCVLGGAHYYVARRIYQCAAYLFSKVPPSIYMGAFILAACVLVIGFARSLLPLPYRVKDILGNLSSYWMGILVYLILFLTMADIILQVGKLVRMFPSPVPEQLRFFSSVMALMLTAVTVSYGIYNANQVRQVSYELSLQKKILDSEIEIVLVSDLHLGAVNSEKRLDRIIQSINDLQPDVVCIAGDIFDNDYYAIQNPKKAVEAFQNIRSQFGVYAALGNHDSGKTLPEMLDFLERSNIKVLKDESVVLDNCLVLAGRLDRFPIGEFQGMERKNFAEVMGKEDLDLPIVVMDHNPANVEEYGSGVDLILSGHTHRGQMFPGSLFTNMMFPVDYGYYQKNSDAPHVIVTSGAGTWGMPMRVGTNCEIVKIRLY